MCIFRQNVQKTVHLNEGNHERNVCQEGNVAAIMDNFYTKFKITLLGDWVGKKVTRSRYYFYTRIYFVK